MNFVAKEKERFLNNFYLKSKRSIAKASNEGPAAYIIPGDTPRPVEAADMVNLLRLQGVEVHRASKEFSVKDQKYPAVRTSSGWISRIRAWPICCSTRSITTSAIRRPTTTPVGPWAMRNVKTVRVVIKCSTHRDLADRTRK